MKSFNTNAVGLIISFTCEKSEEKICLSVENMPEPNYFADSINKSENSTEEILEGDNGRSYRVVIYKNTAEGNVEIFDITDDEIEIEDFNIEELFIDE